jgi:hypothetical protein
MVDSALDDLFAVDRDVARAFNALARWRARLASDPEGCAGEDPLLGLRHVAAKSTADALAQQSASVADEALRDALCQWVRALVLARIELVDELAHARAAAETRGRFEGESPKRVSWREVWPGAAFSKTPAEARLWLRAAADVAPPVASLRRIRAARRIEVARRMSRAHPWDLLLPVTVASLRGAAGRLLDETEDVWRAEQKAALGEGWDAAATIHGAVARDASEGWPGRLSAGWLEGVFGPGARGLPIRLDALPRPVGAASFARALCSFGFAVRIAMAPASVPFALSREPAFVSAYRLGFVFGSLASDSQLHLRVLQLGRRQAAAQARTLARTALFEARLHAARILLGDDAAPPSSDLFTELTERLFGLPLDGRFCGAWPVARFDEPARLVALLQALGAREQLRERFDVDWFRNPRAWTHLRESAGAAREPVDERAFSTAALALARAFEEALG